MVIYSCKKLKISRLFGTISDLISPLLPLTTIPHNRLQKRVVILTWRCSCSFNPQDGVMLTLRVVKAQQGCNREQTAWQTRLPGAEHVQSRVTKREINPKHRSSNIVKVISTASNAFRNKHTFLPRFFTGRFSDRRTAHGISISRVL